MLNLERYQYGVGRRFNLFENHWASGLNYYYYRFLTHLFFGVYYHHHIVAIVSLHGFASETAVSCSFHRVATCYAHCTCILGSVVIILQTEWHITIATLLHIFGTISDTGTWFLNQTDGKVGLLRFFNHVKVLLYQIKVYRFYSFLF